MRNLLLKKSGVDDKTVLSIVEPTADSGLVYTLVKQNEALLTGSFTVLSKKGDEVAAIKMEHLLFTPAKMPRLTISTKGGPKFIVKKEIEQLCDVINVEGEDLTIGGNPFSDRFELLCKGRCIAIFTHNDVDELICIEDENYELLAALFAFALKLAS